jgi:hypothetical protein
MSENLDKLEREAESLLASMSDDLSVAPADAAILRVKAAVRHELNESWLADQSHPTPSPLATEQARSAARTELEQTATHRSWPMRQPAWVRAVSALAAAAMIAIGFTVIYQAGLNEPATKETVSATGLEIPDGFLTEDPLVSSLSTDMDEFEAAVTQGQPEALEDLQEIMAEIDELLADPESEGDMTLQNRQPQGALG